MHIAFFAAENPAEEERKKQKRYLKISPLWASFAVVVV